MNFEDKKFLNIRDRVFKLNLEIIDMYKKLPRSESNLVIIRQLLRSCTSVGANLEESVGAYSRNEFIYSMNIARKESRETHYWLKLISASHSALIQKSMQSLVNESEEILKVLSASVNNSRKNDQNIVKNM